MILARPAADRQGERTTVATTLPERCHVQWRNTWLKRAGGLFQRQVVVLC